MDRPTHDGAEVTATGGPSDDGAEPTRVVPRIGDAEPTHVTDRPPELDAEPIQSLDDPTHVTGTPPQLAEALATDGVEEPTNVLRRERVVEAVAVASLAEQVVELDEVTLEAVEEVVVPDEGPTSVVDPEVRERVVQLPPPLPPPPEPPSPLSSHTTGPPARTAWPGVGAAVSPAPRPGSPSAQTAAPPAQVAPAPQRPAPPPMWTAPAHPEKPAPALVWTAPPAEPEAHEAAPRPEDAVPPIAAVPTRPEAPAPSDDPTQPEEAVAPSAEPPRPESPPAPPAAAPIHGLLTYDMITKLPARVGRRWFLLVACAGIAIGAVAMLLAIGRTRGRRSHPAAGTSGHALSAASGTARRSPPPASQPASRPAPPAATVAARPDARPTIASASPDAGAPAEPKVVARTERARPEASAASAPAASPRVVARPKRVAAKHVARAPVKRVASKKRGRLMERTVDPFAE